MVVARARFRLPDRSLESCAARPLCAPIGTVPACPANGVDPLAGFALTAGELHDKRLAAGALAVAGIAPVETWLRVCGSGL